MVPSHKGHSQEDVRKPDVLVTFPEEMNGGAVERLVLHAEERYRRGVGS